MNEDIQAQLLKITMALDKQNVKEFVFLCGNMLTAADKRDLNDGTALFRCLHRKGLLSQDDLSFLKEILYKIGRIDILKQVLLMTQDEIKALQKSPRQISSYRSLLYDISQELDASEVKNVTFHVYPQKAKLQDTDAMLDVIIEMEKDLLVKEDNLEKLKKTLAVIGRQDLRQKILSCEKQEEQNCLSSAQEKMPIQENPTNEIKEDGSGKGRNLEQYTLDKNPHGWCVILNNEDFKIARNKNPKLNDRSGTNKDAEAIKRVFEKRHYIVEEHKNLTKQNMLDVMKEYGKKDHSQKDSFICFILSHGHTGTVLGVDGEEVPIRNLTSCFNGPNCYFLIGKPKIFFIQACQGGKFDTGVPYEEDSSTCTHESDGGSLPVTADFLTAYASTEGYVSLRDPTEGSVYIQNLCKALDDPLYIQEDLKDILTILQNDIADEVKRIRIVPVPVKQMPSYKSELRKKMILPPPENV